MYVNNKQVKFKDTQRMLIQITIPKVHNKRKNICEYPMAENNKII